MGAGDDHVGGTSFAKYANGTGNGSTGVDHVVQQHTSAARNIANHAICHNFIGHVDATGFVNKGQGGVAKRVGPLFGDLHAARIGGDHADVVQRVLGLNGVGEYRHGVHVIDRTVKKALDLVGVQVHGDDAVGTGGVEHVRN